jgi:hypothetical protein
VNELLDRDISLRKQCELSPKKMQEPLTSKTSRGVTSGPAVWVRMADPSVVYYILHPLNMHFDRILGGLYWRIRHQSQLGRPVPMGVKNSYMVAAVLQENGSGAAVDSDCWPLRHEVVPVASLARSSPIHCDLDPNGSARQQRTKSGTIRRAGWAAVERPAVEAASVSVVRVALDSLSQRDDCVDSMSGMAEEVARQPMNRPINRLGRRFGDRVVPVVHTRLAAVKLVSRPYVVAGWVSSGQVVAMGGSFVLSRCSRRVGR